MANKKTDSKIEKYQTILDEKKKDFNYYEKEINDPNSYAKRRYRQLKLEIDSINYMIEKLNDKK